VGEAKQKATGFWPADTATISPSPVRTFVDPIQPGDEMKLLRESGIRAERCRRALGAALRDLVMGANECAHCHRSFESLDDLGMMLVSHVIVNDRAIDSPSWPICRSCVEAPAVGTTAAVLFAEKLVHEWMSKQGAHRLPNPR
jgi:hypothetical protein